MNLFQNNQNLNNYGSNIQILPMNNLQNNNLIQQLNEEKKKLKEEIQRLKNININLNNELNILRNNILNLKNENNNLKSMLSNSNQFNQFNQVNINEINKLRQIISQKDNEINELKIKLKKNKVYISDIIVVNFLSGDGVIRCGISCLAEDTFADVEEKLYQRFKEYRNTNNILLFKGNQILRFKKVRENNIRDGDTIQVVIPE